MYIPKPQQIALGTEKLLFQCPVALIVSGGNPEAEGFAELFRSELEEHHGCAVSMFRGASPEETQGGTRLELLLRNAHDASGPEAYVLSIKPNCVRFSASTAHGLFNATRTFRQLLYQCPSGALPVGTITDGPRFSWRGFMLDCSRHFFSVAYIKRLLDLMALHKLNVFHWHLIDNGGWRLEVESYPKLIEIAAWRGPEGERYGGYYTKADVRQIVAYAAQRFITVVPEFEMPGHSDAALAAYPELTCSGQAYVPPDASLSDDSLKWWYSPSGSETAVCRPFCAGREEVFQFHEAVFEEALELFPSPVWHVGGDERPAGVWEKCPRCQERMRLEGLGDEHELQAWFMRRITAMLAAKGKRVISWGVSRTNPFGPRDMDSLGHGAMIQNWHDGVAFAAGQGWDVVNSNNHYTYFDYPQTRDPGKPRWMPQLSTRKVYAFDPLPGDVEPGVAHHVLGAEACLWTEQVPEDMADKMTFPRLLAFSEVCWTAKESLDFEEFRYRLRAWQPHLERAGIQFGDQA